MEKVLDKKNNRLLNMCVLLSAGEIKASLSYCLFSEFHTYTQGIRILRVRKLENFMVFSFS
jgi:hypothetical protein